MALLTDAQLHEIRDIIRNHHSAFIVNVIGPDAVAPEILDRLKAAGMVKTTVSSIEDAYLYGQALASASDPKVAKMSFDEFRTYLRSNPVQLTEIEKRAVDMAKHQAAQYVTGLGNRIDTTTGALLIEADTALRRQRRDQIRTGTAENIARRETIKRLVSDLGHLTKDWARDWHRIAVTEKHNAMQHGVADHYAKRFGPDVRVFKRPTPDACEHCKRLHLGPDGHPRIFKLSDLESNGTNVGRKANAWLPTIGPVHPHCQCQLIRIPAGWGFNEEGEMVPGGEFGVEGAEDLKLAMAQEADLKKGIREGHVEFQGIKIRIENQPGTKRRWTDAQGKEGVTQMVAPYGYIERTQGEDEEEIDVYVGPNPRAASAFVVDQLDPLTGVFDERKVFLGYDSAAQVRIIYSAHHNMASAAWGGCTEMAMDHFKRWISGTAPKPGEMLKAKAGTRFVIPLQKAIEAPGKGLGTVSGQVPAEIGAHTSQAAARAPGYGAGVNFMGNAVRTPPETVQELQEWNPGEKDPKQLEHERRALTEDPLVLNPPKMRFPVHEIEVSDESYFRHDEDGNIDYGTIPEEEAERIKKQEKLDQAPRNYTDPGEAA